LKVRGKKGVHHTKEQFRLALVRTGGLVSHAAKLLGCTTKTIYNALHRWPELAEVIREARDNSVDDAEHCLRSLLSDGNLGAAIFTLKTLGKSRGYVERLLVQAQPVDVAALMLEAEESVRNETRIDSCGLKALGPASEPCAARVVPDSGRGEPGGFGE
jgi:hypothetical protein